jgi:hypothetical protein
MKFKLTTAIIVSSFFSVATVQAATDTPDILSSVSPGSVQTLSKAESASVRGEYYTCYQYAACFHETSFTPLPAVEYDPSDSSVVMVRRRLLMQSPAGFYASR